MRIREKIGFHRAQTMRNPTAAPRSTAGSRGSPTSYSSKDGLRRGPWTPEEDEILSSFVDREGEGKWRTLPKRAGLLRCGESCRLRWMNYLSPGIKHTPIASDEEDLILRLHRLLGNKWSLIAGRLPGRTDNDIKNYWICHLSKKLISQGIDPRTHRPFNQEPSPAVTAPVPYPNLTPNPNEAGSSRGDVVLDHQVGHSDAIDGFGDDFWQFAEGFELQGYGDDVNVDMDDEIFSSFLDSLINDEECLQQQDQHHLVNTSNGVNHEYGTQALDVTLSTLDQDVRPRFRSCSEGNRY